ncbi:hypothetical protein L484_001671 [Morus notabilis]|uniref:Uncharacterized protein n=1 Tax=Morus notabilis TaxID=981085 RepID=W9SFT0_9ROSA|nr:sulfated surface glycoprotein 185 [Morus notabilis]EXC04506.1 hypothetical protein L484_001671 [Morus notabilis]
MKRFKASMLVNLFLMMAIFSALHPVNGSDHSRKLLDDQAQGGDEKCTPCTQNPPPPPPPSPSPPPPSPPPPPKKPPSPPSPTGGQYCPPPPAPFIYITGPPGELYPVDKDFYYNGAAKSGPISLPILVASGLLGVFAFW